jgi:hypothetical protein
LYRSRSNHFAALKSSRNTGHWCLQTAISSGFFAITGQKLENAASSTPAFSVKLIAFAYNSHFAGVN